jgi:tetratricopeptide (TPR) repeat protein
MAVRPLGCSVFVFLLTTSCVVAQTEKLKSDVAGQEVQRGKAALLQGRYAEAARLFEHAEELGNHSAEVNAGIGIAELQLGNYEAARQRETKVLGLVSTSHEQAEAYNLIGTAWLRESSPQTADVKKLGAAEAAFRRAVSLDPVFATAYFNLGNCLLRQNRAAEGAAAFNDFIDAAARSPASAQNLPVNPQAPAPVFTVTDSAGRPISVDALHGRFVLLDYWATWCPPCVRALPVMRQLARHFLPSQFRLISVNEDSEEAVWRTFVAQQQMDWTQAWDHNAEMYHKFGLAPPTDLSVPRYVLIDRSGFVRRVYSGTDWLDLMVGQVVRTVTAEEHLER